MSGIKLELNDLRESMLTLQAELKIDVDNFHRIKKDISDFFVKFCKDSLNINLGTGEQVSFIFVLSFFNFVCFEN